MGTKVIKLENKNHGSYQFETSYNGNIVSRLMELFMNFHQIKKSLEHLKWRICQWVFNLNI
jgi:lipid II:glycine glycyltransferase (peptidoglycan interpeptide bridge formation enzyme)